MTNAVATQNESYMVYAVENYEIIDKQHVVGDTTQAEAEMGSRHPKASVHALLVAIGTDKTTKQFESLLALCLGETTEAPY